MSSLLRTASFAATGVALLAAPSAVAAPWAAPVTIDDAPVAAFQPSGPRLASDAAGNLTAAWIGGATPTRAVYVATKPRGGKWSAAKQVSGTAQSGITDLTLSVNDAGAAIAGWHERRSYASNVLRSSTRTSASGTWTSPVDVQPAPPAGSAAPFSDRYAIDLIPGGAISVWHRRLVEELHGTVVGQESGAGYLPFAGAAPWQAETGPAVSAPRLGVDGSGTATLVDIDDQGQVVARTRPVGGGWSAPAVVGSADGGPARVAALAVNGQGAAVVAWTREAGDVTEVRVARRSTAGVWGAPSTLAVAIGDGLYDPQAAIDQVGRATVTWARFAASASEYTSALETSAAPADGSFTAATTLTTWQRPTGDGSIIPGLQWSDLSVNANGQALLTWLKGSEVQGVTRDKDQWSAPETVTTTTSAPNRAFDGELGPDQTATVVVTGDDAVRSVAKNLSTAPKPTGRALAVSASLASWTGRCPAEVTAYGNGRSGKLQVNARNATRSRCTASGTIPQPASAKVGSSALVLVSGSGLLPVVVTARVISTD